MIIQSVPTGQPPRLDLANHTVEGLARLDPSIAPAFLAHGAALANLDKLAEGKALCVTTGQQPGLLTGPSLTIHKAMSAVAAAHSLEARLGTAVVPVFWVAGDDHDFAESNHFYLLDANNEVDRVVLRERGATAPLTPLYKEMLSSDIEDVLATVTRTTPDTEFRPDVMDWLTRHYHPESDIASAFAGALAELLGKYGVVVFRPTEQAAKKAAAPFICRALERAADINAGLATQATRLAASGEAVPVSIDEQATTVMIEATLGRDRLLYRNDSFVARRSGESWSQSELLELLANDPERFSPNVLLRPVVEAALLPTIAYVAGPGEMKYLAQADSIYEVIGVEPQSRIARWSGRIIEPRVARVLKKYDITPDDISGPDGQLEARLVRDDMPVEAESAIAELRQSITEQYDRLVTAAGDLDPTLRKPIESAGRTSLKDLAHAERRIISHLKLRNEIVIKQLAKARHSLYPQGKPQERVLNIVPFLIRYGDSLLDQVLEKCVDWNRALETVPADT